MLTNSSKFNPNKQINFEAIRIKQIAPEYYPLKRVFETELDMFVQKNDNVKEMGKGLSAVVYQFNRFKDIVFKKSKIRNFDFADEIEHLKELPKSLDTVQKFIAQAFDDKTGLFYLLSTKMKGKPANPSSNPYTKVHLSNMFNTFFELDKKGIYHGDFNSGNLLLEKDGKVNLIDFQWMKKTDSKDFFKDKPDIVLPNFIISENAQMFEMASLPFYLKDVPNGRTFFKSYLQSKAKYHEKRAQYLQSLTDTRNNSEKSIILKGINFENAQSLLFRDPDNDIIKLEAKKLQFLTSFREAFSRHDIKNNEENFITSISAHLYTLSSIQNLRREIAKQIKQKYMSNAKKDYLKYTDEYAKHWFNNIKSWIGAIADSDIQRAIHSDVFPQGINSSKKFESMINVSELIDKRYKTTYTKGFDLAANTEGKTVIKEITSGYKKLKSEITGVIFDFKITQKQNEIKRINDKIQKAFKEDRGLDVINYSILNIIKNRELKKLIAGKPIIRNRDEIITQLHYSRLLYEKLVRQCFKYVFREISTDIPVFNKLTGYEGMYKFS